MSATAGPRRRAAASCQPSDPRAGCCGRVEPVATEEAEVDPPDESEVAVHDHELLVVAVHRPLAVVEGVDDLRPARELLPCLAYLAPRGVEERKRRAGPGEDPHLDPRGRLGQELAQGRPALAHPQLGREVPAREPDTGARGRDGLRNRLQRFRAVHEHVDRVPFPRGRVACSPAARRSVEYVQPAEPCQPPPVVGQDQAVEPVAERLVGTFPRVVGA